MVYHPKAKILTRKACIFVLLTAQKNHTNKMYSRGVNVNYRRRIRQIVVLLFTIIMGILISQATQAEGQAQGNSAVTSSVR
jgi:hypothetical protein